MYVCSFSCMKNGLYFFIFRNDSNDKSICNKMTVERVDSEHSIFLKCLRLLNNMVNKSDQCFYSFKISRFL